MRTTVDIPDEIYSRLKMLAASEGGSIKQLLLRGAETVLEQPAPAIFTRIPRLSEAPVKGGKPGSLKLTNETIDDLLHAS